MVLYALYVGAKLDGLTNLRPRQGCDDPNYPYYLKLWCNYCGAATVKDICVSLSESIEMPCGETSQITAKDTCVSLSESVEVPSCGETVQTTAKDTCVSLSESFEMLSCGETSQTTAKDTCVSLSKSVEMPCWETSQTTAKDTCVSLSESVEMPKGSDTVNLIQKCKICGREGTITMIPGQGTPLTIEQSQRGEKACLMVFDCRGYEPFEFSFADGWTAESLEGTSFDINCSEGEFADYDEKGECPVGLGELESTFKAVKKSERTGTTQRDAVEEVTITRGELIAKYGKEMERVAIELEMLMRELAKDAVDLGCVFKPSKGKGK